MPRQARIVVPGIPHHIIQRGNYRQVVFEADADYNNYLLWLKEYSEKYALGILGYCLMSNHVHFIVIPRNESSLSRVFNTLHMRYAQYINHKRKANGHLWQGRFYSCILDEAHLYQGIRYIERNPVRAKMVKRAWEYKWSSAKTHVGEEEGQMNLIKYFGMKTEEWKEYLTETDMVIEEDIRLKTQRGLAMGTDKFIRRIENKINRSLECLNPGRPRKQKGLK